MLPKLTEALIAGEIDEDVDRWLYQSLGDVTIVFEPEADDLRFEAETTVLRYWQSLDKVHGVAQSTVVDPYAVRAALGSIMLLDVINGGETFYYSLYGSRIADNSGFDMTHKRLSDLPTIQPIQTFFLACYRAVVQSRRPLFTIHAAPENIMIGCWRRLLLPMGRDGTVTRILVSNMAVRPDGRLK